LLIAAERFVAAATGVQARPHPTSKVFSPCRDSRPPISGNTPAAGPTFVTPPALCNVGRLVTERQTTDDEEQSAEREYVSQTLRRLTAEPGFLPTGRNGRLLRSLSPCSAVQ
jgi:hypothetical protein